ncbi:hypothetical protein [Streptosporangium sp. NBC_01756]|uniref:hypothetical protein n=1 Tax=Streptosporangium sp. NBC_01756 TaxID=2975950 RepID=UPI002DD7C9D1|nr:hypothetical protein [Streptosporangium sp. NBC_01756]WSC85362.1 hypothetical protein OIE48_34180 [Streptosporangium sp. NBC_01756]
MVDGRIGHADGGTGGDDIGVADHIAVGRRTAAKPADACVADLDALDRLLRYLRLMCPVFRGVRLVGFQTDRMFGWSIPHSIGMSITRARWRRCRSWKISRYSKIALAGSMRVFPHMR